MPPTALDEAVEAAIEHGLRTGDLGIHGEAVASFCWP